MERFAEVSTLLASYASGFDDGDPHVMGQCFTEDGVFELGLRGEPSSTVVTGRNAIVEFMATALAEQGDVRRHYMTNVAIREDRPDELRVSSYLLLGVAAATGLQVVQSGRYDDFIVWREGPARFARRHLVMDGAY